MPAAMAALAILGLNMCWFPYRSVFVLETPFTVALDGFLAAAKPRTWGNFPIQPGPTGNGHYVATHCQGSAKAVSALLPQQRHIRWKDIAMTTASPPVRRTT